MEREIIDFICPKCGCNKSYKDISSYAESGECISCGELTYFKQIKEWDVYIPPTIKCPYCNSTNTKKISTLSKAGNVAMWGVFALGKISKEWHCNNCDSDF